MKKIFKNYSHCHREPCCTLWPSKRQLCPKSQLFCLHLMFQNSVSDTMVITPRTAVRPCATKTSLYFRRDDFLIKYSRLTTSRKNMPVDFIWRWNFQKLFSLLQRYMSVDFIVALNSSKLCWFYLSSWFTMPFIF